MGTTQLLLTIVMSAMLGLTIIMAFIIIVKFFVYVVTLTIDDIKEHFSTKTPYTSPSERFLDEAMERMRRANNNLLRRP